MNYPEHTPGTVGEALWWSMGSDIDNLPERIGLDPNMPLEEFKRRMRMAQLVIEDCEMFGNSWWIRVPNGFPEHMDPRKITIRSAE